MHAPARRFAAHRPLIALLVALGGCNNDPSGTTEDASGSTASATSDGSTTEESTTDATPTTGAPGTDGTTTAEPTSGGTTTGEPLTRVEQILAGLDVAMYQCPERAWPDVAANYRSRQVLLASELENKAWLWNAQKGGEGEPPAVLEGPLDSLPPEWTAVFNVDDLGGARTLGISLDWTADLAAEISAMGGTVWPDFANVLTFHEGFHFLSDQDDWSAGNGSRSTPYPEPWEPRYLRAQLRDALHAEVTSAGAGLAAAAHWQGRLLAEYSAEMQAIRSYDCTEGSAEYVSLMMAAIAELGCDATDPELLDLAISHLPDGIYVSDGFDVGREPYDLGVLAGLILRRAGVPGWELKVEDGDTFVDQALAGVTAKAQPDDPKVQADAQAAVDARNVAVGMEIEPMLAHMKDPAYTRIVLSFNWITGSFGVGGFYYLAEDPALSDVLLTFSASMVPPSQVPIEITDFTALEAVPTPCKLSGGSAVVLALPTADLAVAAGKATVATPKLSFSGLAVEPTLDADDLPWLCPVDAGGASGAVAPQPDPVLHLLRAPARSPQPGAPRRIGAPVRP